MSKLTITIEADDIPDMAAQLADLHTRFSGIAKLMATTAPTGEKQAIANTPLEGAIAVVKEREVSPPPPPPPPPAAEATPPKRGRAKAADKTKPPPTDRFFDDEGATTATSSHADPTESAPPQVEPYFVEIPTEPLYLDIRAKAKLYYDAHGEDELAKVWTKQWPFVMGDKLADFPNPSIRALDGQREAIIRALSVFNPLTGHDPITGELTGGSSAAADLL